MKKTIAVLLTLILAFALSVNCLAASYGDLNNDNKIDSSDALLVLMASTGIKNLTPEQKIYADVSADGEINSSDALSILMRAVGLIDIFPIEEGEEPDIDHGFIG
ncbi:MAG: dockerin type I repeat-containing protein [Clostridia bacterium]|nr:dockerin type I repeat-containing protein [Clostridia bacterium]